MYAVCTFPALFGVKRANPMISDIIHDAVAVALFLAGVVVIVAIILS